jgi:nucleoside-diphosphate-sugar epimerase
MKGETLLRACAEVDVIVSAVGNNEVTVPGQKNLIDAAKQQGVKRFIPSDYSVDYSHPKSVANKYGFTNRD